MNKAFPYILSGAVLISVAGAYLGNRVIAVGQGLIIVSFIIGGIGYSRNRDEASPRVPASLWCLLLLVAVNIVSMVVNWESYDRPFKDLKKIRYLLIPAGLLLLPWCRSFLISHSGFLFKNGLKVLVGLVTLITVASFIGLWTGFHPLTFEAPKYDDRISGIFGLSLTFANSLILTFLVLVGILISSRRGVIQLDRKIFLVLVPVVVLLGIGVYFSMSRGAILASFCGLGVAALAVGSRGLWISIALAVVAVVGISLATNNMFVEKFKGGIDSTRLAQWKTASLTFLDHPVLGVGFRQFEKQCGELKLKYGLPPDQRIWEKDEFGENQVVGMRRMVSHAHNNYLEAFASTGVFGGLAFLSFVGFWAYEMLKDPLARVVFLPMVVAFAVAGFFENTFTDSEVLHWIMLLYVGSQLLLLRNKSSVESSGQI